jgi:hypothetical protein
MKNFKQRNSFGKLGQDILINFLEKHFGYKFEAGERGGETLNVDLIEELEHCEYIPPTQAHGSQLRFTDNGREYKLTMPDVFMSRNSSSGFYWIEAKRHTFNYSEMIINKNNFEDYKILYEKFTRQEFYVMCLNPRLDDNNNHDLYWCEFQSLLDNNFIEEKRNGVLVCVWNLYDTMKKLNKYPIDIYAYRE